MKIEILSYNKEVLDRYEVKELSVTDFQQWGNNLEGEAIEIPMPKLLSTIEQLQPADQTTKTVTVPADIYLPPRVKDELFKGLSGSEYLDVDVNMLEDTRFPGSWK